MSVRAAKTSPQHQRPDEYGRLAAVWRAHPRLDEAAAIKSLEAPQPAWQLSLDGYVVAANLSALWLWQAESAGHLWQRLDRVNLTRLLDATDVLDANVFDDVYARSARRIPVSENVAFWTAKARVFCAIGRHQDSPFLQAMLADQQRRHIYERVARSGTELKADAWSYPLHVAAPARDAFAAAHMLDFQVTVRAVERAGEPIGFAAEYIPMGDTGARFERLLRDWRGAAPALPYVIHSNLKRRLPLAGAPEVERSTLVESTPPVTLYAGEPSETERAGALLDAAQIGFRVVPPKDGRTVRAEFGDLRYEGLDGVEALVRTLRAMQQAFLAYAPRPRSAAAGWPLEA